MRKLESVIIADTHFQRGIEIYDHVRGISGVKPSGVSLIHSDKENRDSLNNMSKYFEKMIRAALTNSEPSAVIMNYFAATNARVLQLLEEAEMEYGKQTRRFLVTCKSGSKVDEGLGEKRKMVHRISYNSDRSDYLEKLQTAILTEPNLK